MAKVLIVGAGAAGLMAAGAAVRQGHQVTVLEHMDKPAQKILVTGKGRCNVTNDCTAEESFCTGGWLSAVSVLGVAAIWRNLKNRRNAPPVSVRCTLLIRQRTPCSESRAFGWQLPSRTPKPCKVRSCRTPIPFPHKYRKRHCPFRFLQQKTAACCICSGNCCNQAKFEYAGRESSNG